MKRFTGISENRAYPHRGVGFGEFKMATAGFGKVGLVVQLGELLAKTAEALSKFGDSIAHLVTLGALMVIVS